MKVTPIKFDPHTIGSEADRLHPRTVGLHLSNIYRDLEETVGRAKRGKFTEEELKEYQNVGYIWEYVVADGLARALQSDFIVRPGECHKDGIIGSPDLWHLIDQQVWETKATYRSFRRMGEDAGGLGGDFWIWKVQMAGYCHMMEVDTARLICLFMNGNYAPPIPMTKSWNVEFTGRELDENWRMLVGHAKKRGWL